VNGQRVRRAALLPNDQLSIAGIRYRVQIGEDEEPPVNGNDHTQQIDAKEVANIIRKAGGKPPTLKPTNRNTAR
jgi:hypothetical protein